MKSPSTNSYATLLTDIENIYTNARRAIVEMYWNIGKRIVEAEQDGEAKAPYGEQLIVGLAKDLTKKFGEGFSKSNLERMRLFYRENSIAPPAGQLTWSKHAELLSIKDRKKRRLLEKKALEKNLSRREVRLLVHNERIAEAVAKPDPDAPIPQLKVTRGEIGTYSIVDDSKVLCPRGSVVLDLGFNIWRLVERAATKDFTITDKPQYTYMAQVENSQNVSR